MSQALQFLILTTAGIHHQPYGEWMEQVARNLTDASDGFLRDASHLIHERDPLFTQAFDQILKSGDVTPIKLPPRSPNLNAFAERFVRSIKEECLSRVVVLGEGHLRLLVREYVEHYHRERNHQGLGNRLLRELPPAAPNVAVRRRKRIGGLLNYYHREAA
jgi:putative transposase